LCPAACVLYPFLKIVGVELSAGLTKIAERNLRTFNDSRQKCKAITAVCIDARAYPLPFEDCVLYLYNPFGLQVMQQFVSAVEKSVRDRARKLFVIYFSPWHRELWDRSELFCRIRESDMLVVYESR
jgi:hypothetical protein